MTGGYTGKILRVDLTGKKISTIDTAKYEEYGGGLGIAAALFWDLAVEPGDWDLQDAYDPRNVVTVMSGPLGATGVPGAGRCNVAGLSPHAYPINWYARTSLGGRFATMMKLAGWDGIAIQGRSDNPVWINIINDKVIIEDANKLWGLDTWETQEQLWEMVNGNPRYRFGSQWDEVGDSYTTTRPAVLCIGPAGENLARIASLVHDSGSGAGQGGYGGVFGSKNLKAISIVGTESVKVADPKAVLDARLWYMKKWPVDGMQWGEMDTAWTPGVSSCSGCIKRCRKRNNVAGGESTCADTMWFMNPPVNNMKGAELIQKLGINAFELHCGPYPLFAGMGCYLKQLYDMGVLGPGKEIDSSPLPMDMFDRIEFAEAFTDAIAKRTGIGDILAEGTVRAAEKWGRLEEDSKNILRFPHWGFFFHWTLPGVEWAYGSLMSGRDINHHDISCKIGPWTGMGARLGKKTWGIEEELEILSEKVVPYTGDPFMFDYGWKGQQAYDTGIYSEHKAKLVAWHRHYGSFWKESMIFCDFLFADFFHIKNPDHRGATPEAEPVFYNAVTGKNISFADSMETGRKIWNLKRAIRVLQGRHRDMEKFAPFMYRPGASQFAQLGGLPVYENNEWSYKPLTDMYLDEDGVEQWKTHFYNLEGWDVNTGWPTRKTLEKQGMKHVADTLAGKNRLGS